MAAGALAFSVMSLLVKVAGQTLPTMEIVWVRGAVTLGLSWVALRRRSEPLWGREPGLLVLRGVLGFIALTAFYFAVVRLPLAEVTVIHYTNPVFTALAAALFLSERIRLVEVLLAFLSLAGVALVARPRFLFGGELPALDPLGAAAALAGAVFSAFAYVTVRRASRRNDPLVIVWYFAVVTTLGSLPFAAPVWRWPTAAEWGVLLGVGLATQAGQVAITRGLELERAGRAMTVGYLQIVFAAVWGALFFGELPDRWSVAGGLVIVGSTFLLTRTRGTDPGGRGAGDPRRGPASGREGPAGPGDPTPGAGASQARSSQPRSSDGGRT